jgi:hypothetical protein
MHHYLTINQREVFLVNTFFIISKLNVKLARVMIEREYLNLSNSKIIINNNNNKTFFNYSLTQLKKESDSFNKIN